MKGTLGEGKPLPPSSTWPKDANRKAEKRASQEPLRNLRLHSNGRGHQTGRPSESEPWERTPGNAWC